MKMNAKVVSKNQHNIRINRPNYKVDNPKHYFRPIMAGIMVVVVVAVAEEEEATLYRVFCTIQVS
jgi:hypothetical protein